jgi:hypothetical protein
VKLLQWRWSVLLDLSPKSSSFNRLPTFAVVNVIVNVAVHVSKVRSGAFVHRNLLEMVAEVR